MLFNSFEFLLFFPTVFTVYWILQFNLKAQNVFLLFASYFFYAWWDWRFLSLIIFSSVVDYVVGLRLHKAQSKKVKKRWLLLSLSANLGLLGVFKYYNFFIESFVDLVNTFGWQPNDLTMNVILPVGISFYTFQTLSYTLDIYRGTLKPTRDVIAFFTYISFFPQLVAGPIERASNLLPQVLSKRTFTKAYLTEGILQILVGLFRKVVVADTLAKYVDVVYGNIAVHDGTTIVLATLFYAFQIYFDFSGYSDIAIGTAKLMGFSFMRNFNLPYFAVSLTDFWRRWHISLSHWLRDYLYISLGGNRKGIVITYRNLMITMLLGGLWHGSSWNFVIWGGIHGVVLSMEKFLNAHQWFRSIRSVRWVGRILTFIVVLLAWVFFRAKDFDTALLALTKVFQIQLKMPYVGDITVLANCMAMLTVGLVFDFYLYRTNLSLEKIGSHISMAKLIVVACVITLLITLFYSTSDNFIYFQF
ncbi:MBOAT family O-acyltransferase [Pseudozobellia thermophila]|uniref:D-alanyl-lipoteichoic acid acyltransferase DltB, MBOAT superfamily n=1 Tax=Pseudozobellia thermophila TaxID=192903 RepID=A0A1M6IVC2_9FLAO|nr:MBOAT family O-acyltransferase [Pseudozobellia thermophila]SHJ38392.1 D-alanyl-lipoteichoic acid acyltransferase DltB, MBOAT superfamily [Pseudozobellia thermophila]